jgi:hypothetical protein
MITLFVLPLILAFAPVAVWALRVGGLRWLLCALALLALLLVALLLSAIYSVPSVWRVVGFVGPSILFATSLLTLASGFARTLPLQPITVFGGSMIGFVVVVYALGVW